MSDDLVEDIDVVGDGALEDDDCVVVWYDGGLLLLIAAVLVGDGELDGCGINLLGCGTIAIELLLAVIFLDEALISFFVATTTAAFTAALLW